MHKASFYIQQINKRYPALAIKSAVFIKEGQYNDVLVVNDALIFRFAKVQPAVKTLRREIAIQQSLQEHITLAIPNPLYHNVATEELGEVFMGYEMIPGKPLWRPNFATIKDDAALGRMAKQLAGFLRELHQIHVQQINPTELPLDDTEEMWANMYQRIRQILFPHMRPDSRRQVMAHFEEFLENPERYQFKPVLRHGDFGTGNIIYDSQRLEIAGIIDFGFTGLGDPATDFAGLYSSFGGEFYKRCFTVYPEMEGVFDRVLFYFGTFALQEALFGVENDDQAAFQSGIATFI